MARPFSRRNFSCLLSFLWSGTLFESTLTSQGSRSYVRRHYLVKVQRPTNIAQMTVPLVGAIRQPERTFHCQIRCRWIHSNPNDWKRKGCSKFVHERQLNLCFVKTDYLRALRQVIFSYSKEQILRYCSNTGLSHFGSIPFLINAQQPCSFTVCTLT